MHLYSKVTTNSRRGLPASIHAHSPLARYLNEDDKFWFVLNLAFFFNGDDDDDGDDYYNVVTNAQVNFNFRHHFCFLNLPKFIYLLC